MEPKTAFLEIIEIVKPLIISYRSRKKFMDECRVSGIYIDISFKLLGEISEDNLVSLSHNLSSTVLKLVVRRVLRRFQY